VEGSALVRGAGGKGGTGAESRGSKKGESAFKRIAADSIVIVSLMNPKEKFWGVIQEINQFGVQIRGIDLNAVIDWAREISKDEVPTMGLTTIFFPLTRLEKIFLDESVGSVKSLTEQFKDITGRSVMEFLRGT
jgi:hypothetical protein